MQFSKNGKRKENKQDWTKGFKICFNFFPVGAAGYKMAIFPPAPTPAC